jgi:hypothetical protein
MALPFQSVSAIQSCDTHKCTTVYNRLRTLSQDTEIKCLSYPTRLNHFCQVAHTLPVGHAALWHNSSNVCTKTVTEAKFLYLLLVSVRRGWVMTPLVGNAVLRRKPQSTFCVSVRRWLHSDISGFLLFGPWGYQESKYRGRLELC